MKEREVIRRNSITSSLPAMKPPHEARLLEKVPIRRSTWSSSPKSSQAPAPFSPRTPTPWASSTISRAPWAWQSSTIGGRSQTSPSIEKTPSTTTRAGLWSSRARFEHRLQLVHPVVAEGPQPGARELAAVEDRGVVARVADDGVARLEDRR